MVNKVLLVVDVQYGLFNKVMKIYEPDQLIANINMMIDSFRNDHSKVIFVRHTNKSLLRESSDDWQVHPALNVRKDDFFIDKHKSNVFDEKPVNEYLESFSIDEVVVVGLVSHGCVKAACLGGIKAGYKVSLISDGHSNFNKRSKEIINEVNGELLNSDIRVIKTQDYIEKKY